MIITPRIRRNFCINAHPAGCAAQVRAQINYVKARSKFDSPGRVLVIGASNGYGLAARIVSAFASGATTIGIGLEKPGTADRLGTAGWYNIEAFRKEAEAAGLPAWNVNGDAFSEEIKSDIIKIVKHRLGAIDFLVYSIAAPRRIDPETGEIYSSVIKPIGNAFSSKTVDFQTGAVTDICTEPATEEQIAHTKIFSFPATRPHWIKRAGSASMTGRCGPMSKMRSRRYGTRWVREMSRPWQTSKDYRKNFSGTTDSGCRISTTPGMCGRMYSNGDV